MGALSIGFDTIIVGALALPWVLLVLHLFFSRNESSIRSLLDWVNKQNQPAVAGVLLFAMTYSLGSAVSRIAQDFFDDDDLHIRVSDYLLRVGVTESSIRSNVYCEISQLLKALPKTSESAGAGANTGQSKASVQGRDPLCVFAGKWMIQQTDSSVTPEVAREMQNLTGDGSVTSRWIDKMEDMTGDRFRLKEAAVLLRGTDQTERLRQFRDQIMVLRGAAFNGMLAFSFCLFWWCSKYHSPLRWSVLSIYVLLGSIACTNHFADHRDSPPFMEFTLLSLAAAGGRLLWQLRPRKNAHPHAQHGRGEIRLPYVFLALFLSVSAFLGWWATQVLYDQQVIYSYEALSMTTH